MNKDLATPVVSPRNISRQLARASAQIDEKLIALWKSQAHLDHCTLVAVGGYGRQEMYPHSDVDILIIEHPSKTHAPSAPSSGAIEDFITALWDTGLHIGHSVRSLEDCLTEADKDITVQTAMLEARYLAGDTHTFAAMQTQFKVQLNPRAFLQAKVLEMQQRHQRYENTPYSLEPNCKESPGGLRDLHMVLWVAKASGLLSLGTLNIVDTCAVAPPLLNKPALGKLSIDKLVIVKPASAKANKRSLLSAALGWKSLQTQGILSATEYRSLSHAEHVIQTIRHTLHRLASRREDRLVFDLQSQVALALGCEAKPGRRASEVLMQHYYLAAKAVSQVTGLVLQALERRILGEASYQKTPLTKGYCEQNGFLHAQDLNSFSLDAVEILRAFHILAAHPHLRDLSADTQRAIWNARDALAQVRRTEPFKQAFMQFFLQPTGLTRNFRRMNALGILGRSLPAFRRIVGQMQHDLFHVYTVDQHILTVLRNMRRFAMPQHMHEYPLCSQLMAGFEPEYVLYIAALFHDIAKGRGGDHSTLGQVDVARFGKSMGMPTEHTELAVFLVKQHLTMSTVAQKSDLSDPETIAKFALLVGNAQRLSALYLLTVADIRGTSPKVWNAWKGKLLENLYHQTLGYLCHQQNRELGSDATSSPEGASAIQGQANPTQHAQNAVKAILNQAQITSSSAPRLDPKLETLLATLPVALIDPTPLWDNLDDAYFLRNEARNAAWHTQVLLPRLDKAVTVACRIAPDGTGIQALVYSTDQAELFARICSCFDTMDLAVLDAQVYTTRKGQALDHFVLNAPHWLERSPEEISALLMSLEKTLAAHLKLRTALPTPRSARLQRQARHFAFAPQCHISPDEKGGAFLLEIQAVDQPSLLYRIAKVFAQYQIAVHTARITTLGGRAEDFFIVSGEALSSAKQQIALETDLLAAVAV